MRASIASVGVFAAAVLLGACAQEELRVATVSGSAPEAAPGELVFESLCSTCHGRSGEGGTGPALAGHTAEQVVRQVRAPVGKMPLFTPQRIAPDGLAGVVEYVTAIQADEAHGGHAHATTPLTKQDVSEMTHVLILRAIDAGDLVTATHFAEDTIAELDANHLLIMEDVLDELATGSPGEAIGSVSYMVAADSHVREMSDVEIAIRVLHNSAASDDVDQSRHWFEHLAEFDDGSVELHELEAAVDAGRLSHAVEVLGAYLGMTDDHADDGHVDEGHDEGEPAHDEGEPAHDEGEPAHDEGDGHHDEGEPAHDEGEPAHDEGEPAHDEGEPAHDEGDGHHDDGAVIDEVVVDGEIHDNSDGHHDEEPAATEPTPTTVEPEADHDDTGTEPHDH